MRIVFVAACLAAASSAIETISWDVDESGALVKPEMFVAIDAVLDRQAMRRMPSSKRKKPSKGFLARAKGAMANAAAKAKKAAQQGIAKGKQMYAKAQPGIKEMQAVQKDLGINAGSLGKAKKWGSDVLSLGTSLWNNPYDLSKWGSLVGKLKTGATTAAGMIKKYRDGKKKRGSTSWLPWKAQRSAVPTKGNAAQLVVLEAPPKKERVQKKKPKAPAKAPAKPPVRPPPRPAPKPAGAAAQVDGPKNAPGG